jgi:glutamyl-tRNA synthetase
MKWGNVTISKIETGADGNSVLFGTVDEADKDFKKTKKITWVCADPETTVEITLTEFDHLISKKKVEEHDDVKQLVNHNSKIEYTAIAEGALRSIQRGVSIQLESHGYFFVEPTASSSSTSSPMASRRTCPPSPTSSMPRRSQAANARPPRRDPQRR